MNIAKWDYGTGKWVGDETKRWQAGVSRVSGGASKPLEGVGRSLPEVFVVTGAILGARSIVVMRGVPVIVPINVV